MNKPTSNPFPSSKPLSPRALRDEMVGKTIAGVIARPGGAGEPPVVLMMRFDDGSVIELVSPRSDRLLKRSLRCSRAKPAAVEAGWTSQQLSFDGLFSTGGAC